MLHQQSDLRKEFLEYICIYTRKISVQPFSGKTPGVNFRKTHDSAYL